MGRRGSDLPASRRPTVKLRKGHRKVEQTLALATQHGFKFAWVDTCCINKTSSAVLSEAINSMFHWYQQAEVCYVYLSDLDPGAELASALGSCRWFTRGWTLQELIAPRDVIFYDSVWGHRGTKTDLSGLLERITGIPKDLLRHRTAPCDYPVACRMSWASQRQTTRIEDTAYCLVGIFDVYMSPRYGERTKAFQRLQHAIIVQSVPDLTIFAWTDHEKSCPDICGMIAESAGQFRGCSSMRNGLGLSAHRFLRATIREIEVAAIIGLHDTPGAPTQLFLEGCGAVDGVQVGVALRKVGVNTFARLNPATLVKIHHECDALPKATVILASFLPGQYQFQRDNVVLGHRHATLLPTIFGSKRLDSFEFDFSTVHGRGEGPFPFGHWDTQDGVFFSTETMSGG